MFEGWCSLQHLTKCSLINVFTTFFSSGIILLNINNITNGSNMKRISLLISSVPTLKLNVYTIYWNFYIVTIISWNIIKSVRNKVIQLKKFSIGSNILENRWKKSLSIKRYLLSLFNYSNCQKLCKLWSFALCQV